MWRSVEIDVRVDHPAEAVFAHLADPTTWPDFVPAVVMRRPLHDGPAAVGSRWAAVDRIGPFPFGFTDELVVHEPGRRVAWASSAPWNSLVEYLCIPEDAGTRVRASYVGDLAGWLRLLGLVVPPGLARRILARDFVRLARLLSTGRAVGARRRAMARVAAPGRPPA